MEATPVQQDTVWRETEGMQGVPGAPGAGAGATAERDRGTEDTAGAGPVPAPLTTQPPRTPLRLTATLSRLRTGTTTADTCSK